MSRDAWARYAPGGSTHYDVRDAGLQIQHDGPAGRDRPAAARAHRAMHARREAICARYDAALADLPLVAAGAGRRRHRARAHLYPVLVDPAIAGVSRDELQERLRERGVRHEHPLSRAAPALVLPRALRLRARHVPARRGASRIRRCRCRCRPRCPTADVDRVIEALHECLLLTCACSSARPPGPPRLRSSGALPLAGARARRPAAPVDSRPRARVHVGARRSAATWSTARRTADRRVCAGRRHRGRSRRRATPRAGLPPRARLASPSRACTTSASAPRRRPGDRRQRGARPHAPPPLAPPRVRPTRSSIRISPRAARRAQHASAARPRRARRRTARGGGVRDRR